MKYFILFLALFNWHLGYSQSKSPVDSSFELVVKYTHFQSTIASSSCWGSPVTLTGTVQNEIDKTRLGQEVELVFTQNWLLADFSKSGQYKVKVRYYFSLITDNLQTKLGSPVQSSPKTKLLVLSTQPLSRAFQP